MGHVRRGDLMSVVLNRTGQRAKLADSCPVKLLVDSNQSRDGKTGARSWVTPPPILGRYSDTYGAVHRPGRSLTYHTAPHIQRSQASVVKRQPKTYVLCA